MLESLHKLSDAAVPVNDDDWGSERQVSAENALAKFIIDIMGIEYFETQISLIEGNRLATDEGIRFLESEFVKNYKGK